MHRNFKNLIFFFFCTAFSIVSNTTKWNTMTTHQEAVVRVTAFEVIIDIFEPYRTPDQKMCYGTGFFFDEQGNIVTNAHVVKDAHRVEVTMPTLFGNTTFEARVKSIASDTDLAILQLEDTTIALIREKVGKVPYLTFGNSDLMVRADKVLALGYPQETLKATLGIISGKQNEYRDGKTHEYLQFDAAFNPGNSGGPLLNKSGEVIGINTRWVPDAQSVGYAIPSNNVMCILRDMETHNIVYHPFFFIKFSSGNKFLAPYLNNPEPGGLYVSEVCEESSAYKAGLRAGDMIYELDSYPVDIYGGMDVPWSIEKINVNGYINRLAHGAPLHVTVYRNGERKDLILTVNRIQDESGIKIILPQHQEIDYEIFGGITVMELTQNHILKLKNATFARGLAYYADPNRVNNPILIITKIFSTSLIHQLPTGVGKGDVIQSVNGIPVSTLEEYRNAIKQNIDQKFLRLVIANTDNIHPRIVPIVLPMEQVIQDEMRVSKLHKYQVTDFTSQLILRYENKAKTR